MFHILRVTPACPVLMYCSLFLTCPARARSHNMVDGKPFFIKERIPFSFYKHFIWNRFIRVSWIKRGRPCLQFPRRDTNQPCFIMFLTHKCPFKSIKGHLRSKIYNFHLFFFSQDCFCCQDKIWHLLDTSLFCSCST